MITGQKNAPGLAAGGKSTFSEGGGDKRYVQKSTSVRKFNVFLLHRNTLIHSKCNFLSSWQHLARAARGFRMEVLTCERNKMECTVSWTGASGTRSGMGFVAETGSGHVLMMDGAPDVAKPENGGQNLAPRPMETVLAGTGGCTAYDVVLILKRGRHDVRGCSVKLTSERAEVDPKVFTKIHMQFTVTGKGIPPSAVERAIAMSHDKYCSASIMLAKMAEITTGFDLVEVAA
jgi:putative redox protein